MNRNRWSLDGHRALITGASAGIGLAICRELLGLGAQVLMVARDAALLEQARADLEDEFPGPEDAVIAFPADVTDEQQRTELLDSTMPEATSPGRRWTTARTSGAASSRPTCSPRSSFAAARIRCSPSTRRRAS